MDAFTLVGKLVLDSSAFTSSLDSLVSNNSSTGAIAKGTALGNVMGLAVRRGFSLAVKTGKEIIETGMGFDAMMSKVRSVRTEMTDTEFEAIRQKALELGRTTQYTSEEVANAFYYEAIAGWSVQKMLDGVKGTLDLAAASDEKLGLTSDIVTDALTAFGLEAKDSSRFVDVLAAAAGNSNTNVQMMGEAFKFLAPLAGTMKFSIEDVAVGLGLVANNGIKSAMAGTGLRNILTTLIRPTDKAKAALHDLGVSLDDDTGKIKPFREIMTELREGYKKSGFDPTTGRTLEQIAEAEEKYAAAVEQANQAKEEGQINDKDYQKRVNKAKEEFEGYVGANKEFLEQLTNIGGLRGISPLIAIMKASDEEFNQLLNAVDQSEGAADKMAKTMLDNLQGDITLLNSALDNLKIITSDKFKENLRAGTQHITEWVTTLTDVIQNGLGDSVERAQNKEAEAVADATENMTKSKGLIDYMDGLITKFGDAAKSTEEWRKAMSDLKDLLPGVDSVIQNTGNSAQDTVKALNDLNEATYQQALQKAKENTIGTYQTNYNNARDALNQARVDMSVYGSQRQTALDAMISIFQRAGGASYDKGREMTDRANIEAGNVTKAMETRLKSAAEKLGMEDGAVDGLITAYKDAASAENSAAAKIDDLTAEMERTKAALQIAEQSFAALTADSAQSGLNDLASAASGAASRLNSMSVPSFGGGGAAGGNAMYQAIGGWDIPYDNFLTRLHRGEMVLNATQARKFRDGNYDSGPSAADIGEAVRSAMIGMAFVSERETIGRVVGDQTTNRVNRNIGQMSRRHRYGYGG